MAEFAEGVWITLDSSWVSKARWSSPDRLEIQTAKGDVLPYDGCSEEMFRALLEADSHGQFVNGIIKRQCRYLG